MLLGYIGGKRFVSFINQTQLTEDGGTVIDFTMQDSSETYSLSLGNGVITFLGTPITTTTATPDSPGWIANW